LKEALLSRRKIDANGCWLWTMKRAAYGYGQWVVGQTDYHVHRLSAHLYHGFDLASSLTICHSCDNPPCCNPQHLFVGTSLDNSQDMVRKGRSAKGEHNAQSKLTDAEVHAIRKRYAGGETQKTLANAYDVHQTLVSLIVRRILWKHVE